MTMGRCLVRKAAGFALVLAAAGACAQGAEAGAAGSSMIGGMSWKDLWIYGGSLMYVLLAMSVFVVALALYCMFVMRPGLAAPRNLLRVLVETIRTGSMDEARRVCEYRRCALSEVTLAALDYVRDVPAVDPMLLRDIVEGEGSRQAEAIQGHPQYLLDAAVVAPMVGLLGTVFGMIRAFSAVALDIAKAKPMVLAAGVSQALITTAFGLIVGIPAMAFYAYFRRKAARLVIRLEVASADILTVLLSKRSP